MTRCLSRLNLTLAGTPRAPTASSTCSRSSLLRVSRTIFDPVKTSSSGIRLMFSKPLIMTFSLPMGSWSCRLGIRSAERETPTRRYLRPPQALRPATKPINEEAA